MLLILYSIKGINDYFSYEINKIDDIIKHYPNGVENIKSLVINYFFEDDIIKDILKNKLQDLCYNNTKFYEKNKMNQFFNLIDELNSELSNLSDVIIKKYICRGDIINTVFNSKLFEFNLGLIKSFNKATSEEVLKFGESDLVTSCLTFEILSYLNSNHSIDKKQWYFYTNFLDKSYIKFE